MFKQISVAFLCIVASSNLLQAQTPKFSKLKSGLEYYFAKDVPGDKKAVVGNYVTMHIRTVANGTPLFDSYTMNNNEPVPAQITQSQYNGDVMEGINMMSAGDSAQFRTVADSLYRNGQPMPPNVKSGDMIWFYVRMVTVQTPDEYRKAQAEIASKQIGIDDKLLQDYMKSKNIKAKKTASGIYYMIEKTGNGKHATASDKVKVHYKGYKLDGSTFNSSYDRGQPIEFPLSGVIKGWTEGIPMFEEGGKGTLLIPSHLAYGQNAPPGSSIKANEVLLFDVELLEIIKPK